MPLNHGRRRRWYFGSFSVMADDKDAALALAMLFHTFEYSLWRSWG